MKEYDKVFMKKMGIKNDFCIYHVLHWIQMESGMECEFYVEPGGEEDKSRVYGDKIDEDKITDNIEKYEPVFCAKVRKALCSG